MKTDIVVLSGDGIGPEVIEQALKVLMEVEKRFDFSLTLQHQLFGGVAIDACGVPFPPETKAACLSSSAILLGAVGGSKWDSVASHLRPEAGLLAIRKDLNLFANLRPAIIFPELSSLSCLRVDIVEQGIDLLVVRELTGGLYFGQPAGEEMRNGVRCAYNTMIYDEQEIRRIAHVGFSLAQERNKKLCSVDKANVLHCSKLWRAVVEEVHMQYPDVALSHMYVDNCAMQLVINPAQFDVVLTSNIFGDILSDESGAIVGSLGMLPSASLSGAPGDGGRGLYEPIHGSAPTLAGLDKANPLAAILSVAMMLNITFDLPYAALAIRLAVGAVLREGYRTGDIMQKNANCQLVTCSQMGDLVAKKVTEVALPL